MCSVYPGHHSFERENDDVCCGFKPRTSCMVEPLNRPFHLLRPFAPILPHEGRGLQAGAAEKPQTYMGFLSKKDQ